MARVGFDLDGVAYDFQGALRDILIQHYDFTEEMLPEATHWHFYRDWLIGGDAFTGSDFAFYVEDATVEFGLFDYADPINNADNAIRKLHNAGHSIHIITDRNWGPLGEAQRQTVSWLKGNSIPFDSIHFTPEKWAVSVDWMIDDKPSNVSEMRAHGVDAFLLDRPWNKDEGLLVPGIFSVAAYGEAILLDWIDEEIA